MWFNRVILFAKMAAWVLSIVSVIFNEYDRATYCLLIALSLDVGK